MTLASNDYGKTIQRRRLELGVTQEQLAEATGLSQPFIGKLERGAADVQAMKLRNFSALLEQLRWSASDFAAATGMDMSPVLRSGNGGSSSRRGSAKQTVAVVEAPTLIKAEVYAPARAGYPALEGAERHTYTYLHKKDMVTGLELYVVEGDSMTTADPDSIHDGDIIHVKTNDRTLIPNKVFLLHLPGDGLTVKRVRPVGGALWLFSDNPKHEPFRPDEAEVLGRVIGWTRTIRA